MLQLVKNAKVISFHNPVDTGRKLNVFTFNLRPVSTGKPPLVGFWMFSHQVNNCMRRSCGVEGVRLVVGRQFFISLKY